MDTAGALAEMNVEGLTEEQARQLDEDGYFVVPDFFTAEEIAALRAEYDKWEAKAAKSFADYNIEPGAVFIIDLYNKSPVFDLSFRCNPTLAAAHRLLGEIKVYSLNGRNPGKGIGQQLLHSDAARAGADDWHVVNTMILLDDVTEDNGPTRMVPGSHRWPPLNVPDYNDDDGLLAQRGELTAGERALIPADPLAPHPAEIHLTGTMRHDLRDQRSHLAWRHAECQRPEAPAAALRGRPPQRRPRAGPAGLPHAGAGRAGDAGAAVPAGDRGLPAG